MLDTPHQMGYNIDNLTNAERNKKTRDEEWRTMGLFDDIKTGLSQAIEYEKGNLKANTTTLTVEPIERFEPEEIRLIRKETGLTQVLFAKYMGVSVKTVEAWEAGRNHPEGAACRLLSMTRNDPAFPRKSGIVTAL